MLFYLAFGVGIGGVVMGLMSRGGQGRNVVFWSFCAGFLGLAAENVVFVGAGLEAEQIERWEAARLAGLPFLGLVWLLFSLTYSRGNTVEQVKRWKWPLSLLFVGASALAWGYDSLIVDLQVDAEAGVWFGMLSVTGKGSVLLVLIISCMILMNLEQTFRASVGTIRWRIKYMIFGIGLLFGTRIYTSSQGLLYSGISSNWQAVHAGALILAGLLVGRSLWRERTFEIDLYPSPVVLQKSVTILLAGLYFMVIGVLAEIVKWWGGIHGFPLTAFLVLLGVVGFAVLLFSDRFQHGTKLFVSRHLRRPIYDSRKIWSALTEKTASLGQEGELCRAVVQMVSETFDALSVTIWVRREKGGLGFAASTGLAAGEGNEETVAESEAWLADLEREMASAGLGRKEEGTGGAGIEEGGWKPIDLDRLKGAGAQALGELNPSTFERGGTRILAPLSVRGQLFGVMILGDRVNGRPFSIEEMDLLKCIGDQVGANLSGIRLSKQLAERRELEAFQTMSAFFVHDLKNTASTLSLMLGNLKTHFEDPEFRHEALEAVSGSVNRINEMIRRLTLLRRKVVVQPVETDLNQVVRTSLAGLNGNPDLEMKIELGDVPRAKLDPDQVQSVITNLILNAKEAAGSHGQVRVQTGRDAAWIMVSVSDSGCGMSSEFIRNSLFRPFQTTKKTGLGIGMFHSRAIVRAHRGEIEVESAVGKGTVFRVKFPLTADHGTTDH